MTEWAVDEPLTIDRFNPGQPRGFHGRWVYGGAVSASQSAFTYSGPAGGDSHMRAVMAVADLIDRQPAGRDVATAVRNSAKAMYRRDMPTAYSHLDGATYLDGAFTHGQNRPDLEAIRASYAKVPKSAEPTPREPSVPPELSQAQQANLKGRPVPAGVVGSYVARKGAWNALLHPRDPQGRWAALAKDVDKLAADVQQEHHVHQIATGKFRMDSASGHQAAADLHEAADALRDADLGKASLLLGNAEHAAASIPGKRMRGNVAKIAAHRKTVEKHRGDPEQLESPAVQQLNAGLAKLLGVTEKTPHSKKGGKGGKRLVPASPSEKAFLSSGAAHAFRFDPSEPRIPSGQWTTGGGGGPAAAAGATAGGAAAGGAAEKQRLLKRAQADRAEAKRLQAQLRGLEQQHAAAVKAAHHHAAAAKKAATAAGKNPTKAAKAKQAAAKRQHTTHHHHVTQHKAHAATAGQLAGRITRLRHRIHNLLDTAKRLEARAGRIAVRAFDPHQPRGLHTGQWISGGSGGSGDEPPFGSPAWMRERSRKRAAAWKGLSGGDDPALGGRPSEPTLSGPAPSSDEPTQMSGHPLEAADPEGGFDAYGRPSKRKKHHGGGGAGLNWPDPEGGYDAYRAFNRRQPRDPSGRWVAVAGHLDKLASDLRGTKAAGHVRAAAGSLRRGDREGAIRNLSNARRRVSGIPGHGEHAKTIDGHLANLMMPKSLSAADLHDMGGHIPAMMNTPATHAGLAAFGVGGSLGAALHSEGSPPHTWTGRADLAGLDWEPAEYLLLAEELLDRAFNPKAHPRFPHGPHGGEFAPKGGGGGYTPSYARKRPSHASGQAREMPPYGMREEASGQGNVPAVVAVPVQPTPQELASLVDTLHSKMLTHVNELDAENQRRLRETADQVRQEQEHIAAVKVAEAEKAEKRKAIISHIVNVVALLASAALIIATGGIVDISPFAEAGIAVGPLVGGEVINALKARGRKRRAAAAASRTVVVPQNPHEQAVQAMTGLLVTLLGANPDEAAQLAEDLVSDAEDESPDLGPEADAQRTFH